MVSPERTLRVDPPLLVDVVSLSGPFAPTGTERSDESGLEVAGTVPESLTGTYLRNGPNPLAIGDPHTHRWLAGDGMIHGISFLQGRPLRYRNRMVRSRRLASRIPTRWPPGVAEPFDGPVNADVVAFGDRLMATGPTSLPLRLDLGLNTICIEDFDARLTIPLGARPKIDSSGSTMTVLCADPFGPPFLWYLEIDRSTEVLVRSAIGLSHCQASFDFAVTNSRIGFIDGPVTIVADEESERTSLRYEVSDAASMRVGVFERGSSAMSIAFYVTSAGVVSCVAGAFDDGDDLVMDVIVGQRAPGDLLATENPWKPVLERWRLRAETTEVERHVVDEGALEFACVDPRFERLAHRWIFALRLDDENSGRVLVRVDATQQSPTLRYVPPAGFLPGEPCFIADGDNEGDGHLLSFCSATDGTEGAVCIWDARQPGPPVATIALRGPVPLGLRGTWLEGLEITPARRATRTPR